MHAVVASAEPRPRIEEVIRAVRERPSFALYLAALLLFPFKWMSPFSHQQAGWIDVLVAASVITWGREQLRAQARLSLRAPHWFGAAYLALGALSAALAPAGRHTGAEGFLIMLELAALALVTSDFARAPERRRAIVLAILATVFVTGLEAVVALVLFYAGHKTSLLNGWLAAQSSAYARVSAGFYSAPLLGSFCIFASAMLALDVEGIPRRLRRAGQLVLVFVVLVTFSRAILGFGLALVIRWAHRRGTRRARVLAGVAVAAAVFAIAALTVTRWHPDLSHPSATTVTTPFQARGNDRILVFNSSFRTLREHPVLGLGPNSYPGNFEGVPFRPHFTPLNVAATLGLPALLALTGLIWSLWRGRRRPTDVVIWSGLAGLALDALALDVDHFRHVWIMLGFADAERAPPP